MNCKRINYDYEFYVLGALREDERVEFEAHLDECPEVHPELAEAADSLASLAARVERVPVPDRVTGALFARVDAAIASETGRQPNAAQMAPQEQGAGGSVHGLEALLASRWTHPAMGFGVVAIALLVVGGVWLDGRLGSIESDAAELVQTIEALALQETATREELQVVGDRVEEDAVERQELAAAVEEESSTMAQVDEMLAEVVEQQTELAGLVQTVTANESEMMDMVKEQRTLTYMAAVPDRSVNMLWSSQRSASARGMMFMSNDGRIGLLAVFDLPPLPEDRVYQAWLVKDGLRTGVGTFTVDAFGYGQTVLQLVVPVGEFDAIMITVEPAGGSSDPTGDHVLVGDL